jgi:hypothetical protein
MDLKKPKRFRSEEYLEFIRLRECCSCGAPGPSDPHHERKLDPGRPIMGGKISDFNCVPLCRICHIQQQTGFGMDILELYQSAFALLREWVEEGLDE